MCVCVVSIDVLSEQVTSDRDLNKIREHILKIKGGRAFVEGYSRKKEQQVQRSWGASK
jgi:hypothetical protein